MTNIGFIVLAASALQPGSWSGTWTSNGTHVSVVRNVHITPRGWDQTADNLKQPTGYAIRIQLTDTSIAIEFPRGAGNILTVPPCAIGAGTYNWDSDTLSLRAMAAHPSCR
jgi:hypothetical protein